MSDSDEDYEDYDTFLSYVNCLTLKRLSINKRKEKDNVSNTQLTSFKSEKSNEILKDDRILKELINPMAEKTSSQQKISQLETLISVLSSSSVSRYYRQPIEKTKG